MFGEMSILDPGPRMSTATALTAVEAVAMDRAMLREWIAARPEVAEQLLRILARRLRRMSTSRDEMVFTDARAGSPSFCFGWRSDSGCSATVRSR